MPEPWRVTFTQFAFAAGDFRLSQRPIEGDQPVDLATAHRIAKNAAAYGEPLVFLNEAT